MKLCCLLPSAYLKKKNTLAFSTQNYLVHLQIHLLYTEYIIFDMIDDNVFISILTL